MTSSDYYPLVGRSSGIFARLPVEELQAKHPYQWTLFILGYAWIKGTPIPFPNVVQPPLHPAISHDEIGGIHGKPYRKWAGHGITQEDPDLGVENTFFGGYCHHGAVTFPPWHRLYLVVIEQAIGEYADNVAQQIAAANPAESALWLNAAKELRFPYWDWAEYQVTQDGLPSLFYDEELTITATGQKPVTVLNPLSYHEFRQIPEDFGDMQRGKAVAAFTKWKRTYRQTGVYPPDPPVSNNIMLQRELKRQVEDLRSKVGMLFSFPDDGDSSSIYDHFASTTPQSDEGKKMVTGSLEGVHNSIHAVVGGNGHMGQPDYSAFDPFFHFHHANVDRILALWEWCYPDYWMNDGCVKNGKYEEWTQTYNGKQLKGGASGPLIPWRHEDGTYWTSNETRFFTPNAHSGYYTYKEFLGIKVDKPAASLKERQEARARIAQFYSASHLEQTTRVSVAGVGDLALPAHFQSIRAFRLFIIDVKLPHHAFGRSYNFHVFYKKPNLQTKVDDEVLVGNVSVFAREENSPCEGCASRRDTAPLSHGVIFIPPRIISDIIVRADIKRSQNNMETTARLISNALYAQLLDVSGEVLASAQGGKDVAAVPDAQAVDTKYQPAEVTLKSSAVVHNNDDKDHPAFHCDWKDHGALFPSGWKSESEETARAP
ncbi:hypothetical protein PAXRUDRAFT_10469 [Paxillus rubicundulus Ve08.2h10]|uniref:tyrosinase n=1 Tax=Paxillus rubicundulus Ve08.2h10 TaxID=930991 RepID=A0A0D0EB00_9AGAM|nr:hypothetical protein PAXRUDRAFT_10469 [Paxillus rubicundulus Ve08.2h10]